MAEANWQKNWHQYKDNILKTLAVTTHDELSQITILAVSYWCSNIRSVREADAAITALPLGTDIQQYLLDTAHQYWQTICQLSSTYSTEVLASAVACFPVGQTINQIPLPAGVNLLIQHLLAIQPTDIVLDACTRDSLFLQAAVPTCPTASYWSLAINEPAYLLASIRHCVLSLPIQTRLLNLLYTPVPADLLPTKIYMNLLGELTTDSHALQDIRPEVLAHITPAPSNKSYTADRYLSKFHSQNLSAAILCATLQQHTENCHTIAIVSSLFSSSGKTAAMRKQLLNTGCLEMVLALPAKLAPALPVNLHILVFGKPGSSVQMMDASDAGFCDILSSVAQPKPADIEKILQYCSKNSRHSISIPTKELLANHSLLDPVRWLNMERQEQKSGVPLGNLCLHIQRGAMVSARDLNKITVSAPTSCRYLMQKDIADGRILPDINYLREIPENKQKFCLQFGDIVLTKTVPFKTAILDDEELHGQQILFNGNIYALTIDTAKIQPLYLLLYLQSPDGLAQLAALAKGSTAITTISLKDLQSVKIPLPPTAVQQKIAKKYLRLRSQLYKVQKEENTLRIAINELLK